MNVNRIAKTNNMCTEIIIYHAPQAASLNYAKAVVVLDEKYQRPFLQLTFSLRLVLVLVLAGKRH